MKNKKKQLPIGSMQKTTTIWENDRRRGRLFTSLQAFVVLLDKRKKVLGRWKRTLPQWGAKDF